MPEFDYQSVSKDDFKTGRIQAASEDIAKTLLTEQGLTVLNLKRRQPLELGILNPIFNRLQSEYQEHMSISEKILFTSQLSSMIKAGLPLVEALSAFIDQPGSPGSTKIVNKIIIQLQAGVKFSDSLSQFPQIFPPSFQAVIKSGENSGTLAESLNYLALQLRRENDLTNKVKSALIYPLVVVTAMIAVMIFISIFVVPKILVFAQGAGQKLPAHTLFLVNSVSFITTYWYLFLGATIVLAISLAYFLRTEFGRRWLDRVLLSLPVFGTLVARYNQARFARILGGFYLYGVNIISSFDILAASLSNSLYSDSCLRIKQRLTMGESLASAIGQEQHLYPSIMIRLIRGAEKAGELGGTLDKLALFYEEELEVALRNVLALIEPALVFILGFGVLALALVVVVPIYTITSTLK